MIDYPSDQGAVAWSNMLPQHWNKPGIEGFVKSYYPSLTRLTAAARALREQRGVDTAQGAQLDGVGSIVGVSRLVPLAVYLAFFGYAHQTAGRAYGKARYRKSTEPYALSYVLPDEEYRLLIKAKIIQNNGHGTIEEIIAAAKLLFNADKVSVTRSATAALSIVISAILYYVNRQTNSTNIVPGGGTYFIGSGTTNLGAVSDPAAGTAARRLGSSSSVGANTYISQNVILTRGNLNYVFSMQARSNAAAATRGNLLVVHERNAFNQLTVKLGPSLVTGGVNGSWNTFTSSIITNPDTVSVTVYWIAGFQTGAEFDIFDLQYKVLPLPGVNPYRPAVTVRDFYKSFLPISAGISYAVSYVDL